MKKSRLLRKIGINNWKEPSFRTHERSHNMQWQNIMNLTLRFGNAFDEQHESKNFKTPISHLSRLYNLALIIRI